MAFERENASIDISENRETATAQFSLSLTFTDYDYSMAKFLLQPPRMDPWSTVLLDLDFVKSTGAIE